MNKTLFLAALFFGIFVFANKTEALASKVSFFKSIETLQSSPFDPRQGARDEKNETADETGRDDLPLLQQIEE